MLFNSFEYLVFLPLVFFLYWFVVNKNLKVQNAFLLLVSYFFYGWWDWRFVGLLMLSTIIDYAFGLIVENAETKRKKKLFMWLSVFNNLAVLGFFKYFNFFADSFKDFAGNFGMEVHPYVLTIALPVGISFYTFHGMSYVFDIYNGKAKPTKNFVDYAVFVCFFPLLVAGPIERATHLLPQVQKKRVFSYGQAVNGLRQILWGLFKKVVIADNCAPIVKEIFANSANAGGAELILGAVLFAFQIYGDFSGYSDMALGSAKLFGFELLINFRTPYFSRDIAEFWRRWHISLSSWFRDYLYIPLGGSKVNKLKAVRNTFIIFTVSGFWHGANWTFIAWGLLNAIYFLPLLLVNRNRQNLDVVGQGKWFPSIKEIGQVSITFMLTCLAWIFFRAASIGDAFSYIGGIFTHPFGGSKYASLVPSYLLFLLPAFIILDYASRIDGFENFASRIHSKFLRYGLYYVLLLVIVFFGAFNKVEFIYFQF